jgi:hypothetical protein
MYFPGLLLIIQSKKVDNLGLVVSKNYVKGRNFVAGKKDE